MVLNRRPETVSKHAVDSYHNYILQIHSYPQQGFDGSLPIEKCYSRTLMHALSLVGVHSRPTTSHLQLSERTISLRFSRLCLPANYTNSVGIQLSCSLVSLLLTGECEQCGIKACFLCPPPTQIILFHLSSNWFQVCSTRSKPCVYMSSHTDDEWTVLNPTTPAQANMDTDTHELPNKADMPARGFTINTKPDADDKKHNDDCTCEAKPMLVRKDSIESIDEDYRCPRRSLVPPPPIPYTPPPPCPYQSFYINSSTQLLEKVGKEDGVINLPPPATRKVYLTTYPFGDKDVKKWSWLFAAGVEDEYVAQSSRDINGSDMPSLERVRQGRGEFSMYDPGNIDVPSVYLSRALDSEVVPEDCKHNVRYLIVTQYRHQPAGCKLLVAESRRAAGVLMYYDMLKGDSVLFVGATVHQCKTVHPKRYKRVASLEEAVSIQEDGFVGIVC